MSLRSKLKAQTEEVVNLQNQLSSLQEKHAKEVSLLELNVLSLADTLQKDQLVSEIDSLTEQVATLGTSLDKAQSGSTSHSAELDTLRSDLAAAREQVTSSLAEAAAHAETRQQLEATRSELDTARGDLKTAQTEHASAAEKRSKGDSAELGKLKARVKELEEQLEAEKNKEGDDTEHEDLLVLLEELSQKRKRDKKVMREKGLDVSDDEDEDDDE